MQIAVALLLWEMAGADEERNRDEYLRVIRAIDHEFHLMDEESARLVETANILRKQHRELEEALAEIIRGYNPEQRLHLCDLLIEIAKADGKIEATEDDLAKYLHDKLRV